MSKEYLGDAVYVELERGMIKLTVEYGAGAQNTIYMEPEVYEALVRFVEKHRRRDGDSLSD